MDENGCLWINSIQDDIGHYVGCDVSDDVMDVIHNVTSPFSTNSMNIGLGFVWIFSMKCLIDPHNEFTNIITFDMRYYI
jgi:hypothetical protein